MEDVIIRQLTEWDTDAFLRLKQIGLTTDPHSLVASLGDDPPEYPEHVRIRLAKSSIHSGDVILGAFVAGLIGIVAVTRETAAKRRHKAHLHGMYVVPEYRGRGLGRRLLEHVLQLSRGMDSLEEIQLIVSTHNVEAIRLYQRFGFHIVWTETHGLKVGHQYVDAHHMVLDLTT